VWTADVDTANPSRVTTLPRLPAESTRTDRMERRGQEIRAEQEPGVSSVTWHPNNRSLIFAFRGDLYRVEPGLPHVRLTETPENESRAEFSPAGPTLAFLKQGDSGRWISTISRVSGFW